MASIEEPESVEKHKRPEARFICSAANFRDLPPPSGEEYAILGRSNVGKSSFVNHVLENRTLARVSKTPGKTSLANYYRISEDLIWVDLPGYGYARTSGAEKTRWSQLIAAYCEKRSNLSGIIWLIDIRHVGTRADMEAYAWFGNLGKPIFPVLTKGDKLSAQQRTAQVKKARHLYSFVTDPVVYSTQEHKSRERFWLRFEEWRKKIGE